MSRRAGFGGGADSQRTLFAGFPPPALLHDHAHHHADGLPEPLAAARMKGVEKTADWRFGFEFADDARQGCAVVVQLGLLHASLARVAVEELQDVVERLLVVAEHVGEAASLGVVEELLTSDGNFGHGHGPPV